MILLTSPIRTPYHSVPAWLKLLVLCLFTYWIFTVEGLGLHLLAFGIVAALYLAGGTRFALAGLRGLRPLWFFLVVIAVWHMVTATPEAGLRIALRLAAAMGLANLVTMTTRLEEMMDVLRFILAPLRWVGVRTHVVEIAIALVIRFTPEIMRTSTLLSEAWRARSSRRSGWRLVAPLALLTLDDAEHVAEALRARGGIK